MPNKINILNVPEVYDLNAKYIYKKYINNESYIEDIDKRKVVITGSMPSLSESHSGVIYDGKLPSEDGSSTALNLDILLQQYGINTSEDTLIDNSNLEESAGNISTVSFTKENRGYKNNVMSLINDFVKTIDQTGQDVQTSYSNITGQSLNLPAFNSGGGVIGVTLDAKIAGTVTNGLFRELESDAIDDNLIQESSWKYFGVDNRMVSIYRYGVYFAQKKTSLWDRRTTNDDSFLVRVNNNKNAFEREVPVLHGFDYEWSARTVYLAAIKDSDDENDDNVYNCRWVLLMSRPRLVKGRTFFKTPPPLPTDFTIGWDRTKNALQLRWSPPIDVRNELAGLQIYRRRNVEEPFELLCEYDYNNNMVRWLRQNSERPSPGVVKKGEPSYIFYDYDFKRTNGEEYIYTYATISQHGNLSNYGLQLNARWINNQVGVGVGLVSRSGAPKQHPNLFLERATEIRNSITKDVITIENKKKVYLYSDPLVLKITDRGDVIKDYSNYKFGIQSIEHETGKVASSIISGNKSE